MSSPDDSLDLELSTERKARDLHCGPSGLVLAKEFCVDGVDGGEVVHVGEEDLTPRSWN